MSVGTGAWYAKAFERAFRGQIALPTDAICMALLKSTYPRDPVAHQSWADVSAYESTGAGYVSKGVQLSAVTPFTISGATFAVSRANVTDYAVGAVVRPAAQNGHLYMAVAAGTSGSSDPTWPTADGSEVTDGGVTWLEIGRSLFGFTSADAVWPSLVTADYQYPVIYKDAGVGNEASSWLICSFDMGVAKVRTGSQESLTPDALGWAFTSVE